MFDVFIFSDIEMPFTGREKVFCVLEYAQSQSIMTVQHSVVMEFSKQSPKAMQIWTCHKKYYEEGCLCRRKLSGQPNTSEEIVNRICKNIL